MITVTPPNKPPQKNKKNSCFGIQCMAGRTNTSMKCIPKRIQTLSISKLTSKHLTLQKLNGWMGLGRGRGFLIK